MKCFICGKQHIKDEEELLKHIEDEHNDKLKPSNNNPDGFTAKQLWYHEKNKYKLKNIGSCHICGGPKPWDESKNKYNRYCGKPPCTQKLNQVAINNSIGKFGVAKVFELADVQLKIMESKGKSMYALSATDYIIIKASDELSDEEEAKRIKLINSYVEKGASKYVYLSSVEEEVILELLKMYEHKDIQAPAKEIIEYTYPGSDEVRKHIPDIYVVPADCLISCKDSILHPNRHPNMREDRFKNLFEYQAILNTTNHNYFQVEGVEEVKNINSIMKNVESFHSKHSRYVSPPKVDIFVLITESYNSHEDLILQIEYDDLLESSRIQFVVLNEHGVLFPILGSDKCLMYKDDVLCTVPNVCVEEGIFMDVSRVLYAATDINYTNMFSFDLNNIKEVTEYIQSRSDEDLYDLSECIISKDGDY